MPDDTRGTGAENDGMPAPDPQSRPAVPRRRGGQPRNKNAATHLLNSKKTSRENRDGHARRAEMAVREMLVSRQLEGDKFSKHVGDTTRALLAGYYRLEDLLNKRGWVDKQGNPKRACDTLIQLGDRINGQMMKLIDRVAELRSQANPDDGVEMKYVVCFSDGSIVHVSPEDREYYEKCAREGLPIPVKTHVCTFNDGTEVTNRPHAPGDPLPRDLDPYLGQYAPAGDDLSAPESAGPSSATGAVQSPRGASSAKSLNAKVGREVRRRPDDSDIPDRPPGVPAPAIYHGSGVWKWQQNGTEFSTVPTDTSRWSPAGGSW